jgi:hypothetical protein
MVLNNLFSPFKKKYASICVWYKGVLSKLLYQHKSGTYSHSCMQHMTVCLVGANGTSPSFINNELMQHITFL